MAKVLIIADPKDHCSATPRGLKLARKLGLDAEVVAFTYASFKSIGVRDRQEQALLKQQLLEARESEVQQRIDKYARDGQKASLQVVWTKDLAGWVIKRAARGYIGVVKTGHRTGSFLYTSSDWQLLRECPAPVLIVAEKKWSKTRPILATVDLATEVAQKKQLNDEVIRLSKVLAEALDADLRIISVLHISPILTELDLVDVEAYTRKLKASLKPEIERLAAKHDLPESLFRTKRGPVAKVITSDAAKQRAQLVVMGTVGRKGIRAKLLGNTAEEVLRHLQTDVLALKLQ